MNVSTRPPLTAQQRRWSRAVWGTCGALLLAVELAGATRRVGWRTLSETTWDVEEDRPGVQSVLLGFLIGLAVHIRWRTKFGHAEAGGVAIALVARDMWGE